MHRIVYPRKMMVSGLGCPEGTRIYRLLAKMSEKVDKTLILYVAQAQLQ